MIVNKHDLGCWGWAGCDRTGRGPGPAALKCRAMCNERPGRWSIVERRKSRGTYLDADSSLDGECQCRSENDGQRPLPAASLGLAVSL